MHPSLSAIFVLALLLAAATVSTTALLTTRSSAGPLVAQEGRGRAATRPSARPATGATTAPATRPAAEPAAEEEGLQVFFSPAGGCTEAIVRQIEVARRSVGVQAFRLSSPPILAALKDAQARGVQVTVILDSGQQRPTTTDATRLAEADVTVLIDDEHAIAHNMIVIVDARAVLTGSFNFTVQAEERNAENLLIVRDHPQIIDAYIANFELHRKHSRPYKTPEEQEEEARRKRDARPEDKGQTKKD